MNCVCTYVYICDIRSESRQRPKSQRALRTLCGNGRKPSGRVKWAFIMFLLDDHFNKASWATCKARVDEKLLSKKLMGYKHVLALLGFSVTQTRFLSELCFKIGFIFKTQEETWDCWPILIPFILRPSLGQDQGALPHRWKQDDVTTSGRAIRGSTLFITPASLPYSETSLFSSVRTQWHLPFTHSRNRSHTHLFSTL